MGKRRRERDRPKHHPESTYNPHQQAQLSYDSDDPAPNTSSEDEAARTTMVKESAKYRSLPDSTISSPKIETQDSVDHIKDNNRKGREEDDFDEQSDDGMHERLFGKQHTIGDAEETLEAQDVDDVKEKLQSQQSQQMGDVGERMDFQKMGHAEERVELQEMDHTEERLESQEIDVRHSLVKNRHHKSSRGDWKKLLSSAKRDVDEDTGLRRAFNDPRQLLDEPEDVDLEYDSATEDAIAYLLSVQNEREGIPTIISSRVEDMTDSYTNSDLDTDDYLQAKTANEDARIEQIVGAFAQTLAFIHTTATKEELHEYERLVFIRYLPSRNKEFADCIRLLRHTMPHPVQVKELNHVLALKILDLVIKPTLLLAHQPIHSNLGWWIYYLLARLDQPQLITTGDYSIMREFTRRMVYVRDSLLKQHIGSQEEVDNTNALVDTILIILGEHFGQRDLLQLRRLHLH